MDTYRQSQYNVIRLCQECDADADRVRRVNQRLEVYGGQIFDPKDALAEVEEVLALPEAERPAGLVFPVTCDVSAKNCQQARARCVREMECHFCVASPTKE